MYYLDMFGLYERTTKAQRIEQRRFMGHGKRDEIMAYKLKLQHGLCFYCGTAIDMFDHLDHILPIYYGGLNKMSNLVASCRRCNLDKGTGQIEITNQYTITDYLRLINAKRKYDEKLAKLRYTNPRKYQILKRYQPKRVQLYGIYRADRFREI